MLLYNYEQCFWEKNDKGVDILLSHISNGLQTCQVVLNFFKQKSELEKDYSRRLGAINESLQKNLFKYPDFGNLNETLNYLQTVEFNKAQLHSKQSEVFHSLLFNDINSIVTKLNAKFTTYKGMVENSQFDSQNTNQAYQDLQSKLLEAQKHVDDLKNYLNKDPSSQNNENIQKKLNKWSSNSKEIQNQLNTLKHECKVSKKQWYKKWSHIAQLLQELEETRIDLIKTKLLKYVQISQETSKNELSHFYNLQDKINAFNPTDDITKYSTEFGTGRLMEKHTNRQISSSTTKDASNESPFSASKTITENGTSSRKLKNNRKSTSKNSPHLENIRRFSSQLQLYEQFDTDVENESNNDDMLNKQTRAASQTTLDLINNQSSRRVSSYSLHQNHDLIFQAQQPPIAPFKYEFTRNSSMNTTGIEETSLDLEEFRKSQESQKDSFKKNFTMVHSAPTPVEKPIEKDDTSIVVTGEILNTVENTPSVLELNYKPIKKSVTQKNIFTHIQDIQDEDKEEKQDDKPKLSSQLPTTDLKNKEKKEEKIDKKTERIPESTLISHSSLDPAEKHNSHITIPSNFEHINALSITSDSTAPTDFHDSSKSRQSSDSMATSVTSMVSSIDDSQRFARSWNSTNRKRKSLVNLQLAAQNAIDDENNLSHNRSFHSESALSDKFISRKPSGSTKRLSVVINDADIFTKSQLSTSDNENFHSALSIPMANKEAQFSTRNRDNFFAQSISTQKALDYVKSVTMINTPDGSKVSLPKMTTAGIPVVKYAKALFPLMSDESPSLANFDEMDYILITEIINNDWYKGEVFANDRIDENRRFGLIPQNFIEILD